MRNFKRILCTFLAVALLATSFMTVGVFAAGEETATPQNTSTVFSDVKTTDKYAEAVVVLNKLSIINGYTDGTFQPLSNVTRAEFAALLLRMLGMDQTIAPLEAPFPDVDVNFWAAGTIDAAKRLGIITGYTDGTFGPSNNVSYEEALTMIIRAIGYENYSAPGEMWYSTYYTSAQRLDITEDADGAIGTPATRACIAQFIYNTLSVNTRQDDKIMATTIMEANLGINKSEGIIASNSYTSLESPDVKLKENEVMITDSKTGVTATYSVSNMGDYDDMLGATITYYHRKNPALAYNEIIMYTVKNNTSRVTISASLIEGSKCTDVGVAYYKNEDASSTSRYTLDESNVVIYNDKLYGNTAEQSRFANVVYDDKLPKIGSISLLNRDGDSDYDVVFIDSYDVYAVSAVVASTYTVTDKITNPAEQRQIILDYTDDSKIMKFTNTNGSELSFGSIGKNKSICVKKSNENSGTQMITVVIMDKSVTGEVRSISSKGLTVGSMEYKYSPIAPWMTGSEIAAPEKGGKYTFFLDINGEIFAYDKDETAATSANYGYIMNFDVEDGLDAENGGLQILTQGGSKTWIYFYKNTKLNGNSINGDYEGAIETLIEEASKQAKKESLENQGAGQLIKYTTKSSGGKTVFDTIVTVTNENDMDGGDVAAEELRMFGGFDSSDSVDYTLASKKFVSGGNTIFLGSAIVFVVPEDMSEIDNYRKGSASDFKESIDPNIEVFDITSSKTAKVVVLYGGNSTMEVDSYTAAFRVDSKELMKNEAEEANMTKIFGYENGSESLVSYWVSPSSEDIVDELEKGDIVRFGKDSDGFVTLAEEDILFTADMDPYFFAWDETYGKNTDRAKDYNSDIRVVLGTLYSADDDYVIVAPTANEGTDASDSAEVFRAEPSKFSSAKFYKYDTSGNNLEIIKMDGTAAENLESLATYVDAGDSAAKVFVHMQVATVKTVIVID